MYRVGIVFRKKKYSKKKKVWLSVVENAEGTVRSVSMVFVFQESKDEEGNLTNV